MTSSTQISDVAAREGVALVPIGATEQHGPHLPVTTDTTIAAAFATAAAARAAREVATWVLPPLPFGFSPEHAGRPGTIALSPQTLLAITDDIGRDAFCSSTGTAAIPSCCMWPAVSFGSDGASRRSPCTCPGSRSRPSSPRG